MPAEKKPDSGQFSRTVEPVVMLGKAHSPWNKDRDESFLALDITGFRDVIFVEDINLNVTYVSPSVTPLFGYTVEESLKLEKKDYMTPASFERAWETFRKYAVLARTEESLDIPLMEYEYIRKDGSTFWGELKVTFLRDAEGRLIGTQGILRDIDDRKKIEEILRQSELKARTLFELSPQAIGLTHLESGSIVDVNEKFCELTRYSRGEMLGKTTTELGFYSEEDRKSFLHELLAAGEVIGLTMDFKTRDGSVLNTRMFARKLELSNEPHILTVFHDQTNEKRLQHQFLQAQKMESIGNLAGGIAHDFNNLLMGIEGNVSLMLADTEDSHPHHVMLSEIQKHVRSCSELTRQLLGYARKGKYDVVSLDLNRLIEETSDSFQRARKQIKVIRNLAPDLAMTEADEGQIRQVLYNLYVNAADAMPAGGELFLGTANVRSDEMEGRTGRPSDRGYVKVTVADTGIGMDEKIQAHLFEPFFTTKGTGKGTGLGLASVYGIVTGHGGLIDVASEPGKGTTFTIYLSGSGKGAHSPAPRKSEPFRRSGTVLIVDDEETIVNVGTRMLEKLGFEVLAARSGEEAVEIYRARGADVDLVMLDVIMPGMDGGDIYDKLREISPHVKVLLSSGYGREGRVSEILRRGCDGFIQKPFSLDRLSRKIDELLRSG